MQRGEKDGVTPTRIVDTTPTRLMRSNRTFKERRKKIAYDLVFTGMMLTGMAVLCIFKPRYIGLIVRGYLRAVRHKRERHPEMINGGCQ